MDCAGHVRFDQPADRSAAILFSISLSLHIFFSLLCYNDASSRFRGDEEEEEEEEEDNWKRNEKMYIQIKMKEMESIDFGVFYLTVLMVVFCTVSRMRGVSL